MSETLDTSLRYLNRQRQGILWKLDGLGERDLRMPRTPTGTSILGIVKHLASLEAEYFGACLGKPMGLDMPWFDSEEPDADMWATADEAPDYIVGLYRDATKQADVNVREAGPDGTVEVSWWKPPITTVQRVVTHMVAETARHLGHLDILREGIDGAVGHNENYPTMWLDAEKRPAHLEKLQAIAEAASR